MRTKSFWIPAQMAGEDGKIKVCVIGAGAAGLCAARHLAANAKFEVTVYEQKNEVGGTWVYNAETGMDCYGLRIPSMYQNLRTNLPVQVMGFPDYAFINLEGLSSVCHRCVLKYLHNYATNFNLYQYIQYQTKVEDVRVKSHNNRDTWAVTITRLPTKLEEFKSFDAIMVCNGHYFEPYTPSVPDIHTFPGIILHSHSYRKPDMCSGKIVLVLGGSESGIDIATELSNYATCVYLSFNHQKITSPLPANLLQVMGVVRISGRTFYLQDNIAENVDILILCTGYEYSFPFLNQNCGIHVDDNYVSPLYKHLVNIEHPTMCFIGIPLNVVPFPMFHMQVQYFLALLEGRTVLPEKSVMLQDSVCQTPRKKHAHVLSDVQWEYNNSLAVAGIGRVPAFYEIDYLRWLSRKEFNIMRYKDPTFAIIENKRYFHVCFRSHRSCS